MKTWFFALIILSFYPASVPASPAVLHAIQEYLIPPGHPAKSILDNIFTYPSALASEQTLKKAGFVFTTSPLNKIIVAKHPALEGYLIKTYLDNTPYPKEEWKVLATRVEGARQVQQTLDLYGYQEIMKVPQKWIYHLPERNGRQYLLLVEDMHILPPKENLHCYLKKMTKKKLSALYTVITENGLMDSVYIRNIPFCEDGKIAFIDTELFAIPKEKICYACITHHFSSKMQRFWSKLYQPN